MTTVNFLRHVPTSKNKPAAWHSVLSHSHTYSGRADHGGTVKPPESYEQLTAWAKRLNIAAIGMGSPYTPETARQYDRYDGENRGEYYKNGFDSNCVRGDEEIAAMLARVNELSGDSTLFFLDNETPKGRYGHLWWVNYSLDYPAWHDYDQDFDRWMVFESTDDSDEPMPYLRPPYSEIVAKQRAKGALANWAHPTSWWKGGNGQFITNIASEMPAHLIADGYIDGLVVMGYHGFRPEYQELWFALLDRGYRVPGVAEMDVGLSDAGLWKKDSAYLTLIHNYEKPRTAPEVANAWESGRLIASSGAWVELEVSGGVMGQVVPTESGAPLQILLHFGGKNERYDVELISRGGEVLWTDSDLESGTTHLTMPGLQKRGYIVARVFARNNDGTRSSEKCAVSNPVYLHPRGEDFEKPAQTEVTLKFATLSPWCDGQVRFEAAAGELLEETAVKSEISQTMPAGGRITLVDADGKTETHYLINANAKLQDVQRHLYRGRFLRDAPSLKPGEVPPGHWRFDDYIEAMRSLKLSF